MNSDQFKAIRRQVLRMEQSELAELLDCHKNTIGNYERGLQPVPRQTAMALCWLALFGPGDPLDRSWRPRLFNLEGGE